MARDGTAGGKWDFILDKFTIIEHFYTQLKKLLNKYMMLICLGHVADFVFPLFPIGYGLLAVIIMYLGGVGTLFSATACVFLYLLVIQIQGGPLKVLMFN